LKCQFAAVHGHGNRNDTEKTSGGTRTQGLPTPPLVFAPTPAEFYELEFKKMLVPAVRFLGYKAPPGPTGELTALPDS